MPDAVEAVTVQAGQEESPAAICVRVFREIAGLNDSQMHYDWSNERLLREPLEALDVDSLTLLEFVMAVEEAFAIELDEDDVNRCENVGDLVQLVNAARNGCD